MEQEKTQKINSPYNPSHQVERGVIEPLPEVNKMASEEVMATPRQLAYIERLSADSDTKIDRALTELTITEASGLIEQLLEKINGDRSGKELAETKKVNTIRRNDFGSSARLGMAFKCVYRNWITSGQNIFKHKKTFIKNVLDTYALINEIAEKAMATAA